MKKGFTLVELLAVVLVIGILMGIGMPQYRKVIDKARVAEAESMLRTIYDSSERLAGDFGYPSFTELQANRSDIFIARLDMFDPLPAKCTTEGNTPSAEILKCPRFWYKTNVYVAGNGQSYVVAKMVKGRNAGTYILFNRSANTLACQPASGHTSDFCEMLGLDTVSAGLTF